MCIFTTIHFSSKPITVLPSTKPLLTLMISGGQCSAVPFELPRRLSLSRSLRMDDLCRETFND